MARTSPSSIRAFNPRCSVFIDQGPTQLPKLTRVPTHVSSSINSGEEIQRLRLPRESVYFFMNTRSSWRIWWSSRTYYTNSSNSVGSFVSLLLQCYMARACRRWRQSIYCRPKLYKSTSSNKRMTTDPWKTLKSIRHLGHRFVPSVPADRTVSTRSFIHPSIQQCEETPTRSSTTATPDDLTSISRLNRDMSVACTRAIDMRLTQMTI